MPKIKLTQPAVDKLKAPSAGRVEFWDTQLPGFGLRISDRGRKTWIAMYRVKRKLVRETIGTIATIPNVAEARTRARESLLKAQSGVNPVEARRTSVARAAREAAETFGLGADRYLREYVEKNTRPATVKETWRIIERDVKPR
jgi:hypothetical protein